MWEKQQHNFLIFLHKVRMKICFVRYLYAWIYCFEDNNESKKYNHVKFLLDNTKRCFYFCREAYLGLQRERQQTNSFTLELALHNPLHLGMFVEEHIGKYSSFVELTSEVWIFTSQRAGIQWCWCAVFGVCMYTFRHDADSGFDIYICIYIYCTYCRVSSYSCIALL